MEVWLGGFFPFFVLRGLGPSVFSPALGSVDANVCWGPGGVLPFGPLRVLIRLLRLFCSFFFNFVFFSSFLCLPLSMNAASNFEWDLAIGLQCSPLHVCPVRGVSNKYVT